SLSDANCGPRCSVKGGAAGGACAQSAPTNAAATRTAFTPPNLMAMGCNRGGFGRRRGMHGQAAQKKKADSLPPGKVGSLFGVPDFEPRSQDASPRIGACRLPISRNPVSRANCVGLGSGSEMTCSHLLQIVRFAPVGRSA